MSQVWPDIWFLRHGQTEWNLEGRIQGRLDSSLTALGRKQAAEQGRITGPVLDRFPQLEQRIFVSPLGRAQETARIALPSRAFHTDPRLAEIDTGAWEGCLRRDVVGGRHGLEAYCAAPDGEGFDRLQARVRAFLTDLNGPAIVVAHGILGQVLRGTVCGLRRMDMAALSNDQGCIYQLAEGRETRLDGREN